MLLAVCAELFFHFRRRSVAVSQNYKRLHPLHLESVLHANHAAALDGGMAFDYVFKLGRIHVVSACHYHPLDALTEVHKSFLIHLAKVSGVEPYVAVRVLLHSLPVLFLMAYVTKHHRRACEADLAFFTVRDFLRGAGLADLEICIRERNAY